MIITAELIKEFREKHNLTQEKLAELMGVSWRTIQNYEAGSKIPASKNALFRDTFNKIENESKSTRKFNYEDLAEFETEEILDFIIMNIETFRKSPKIDALYRILKSFNNQESLENMHDKIDELTKLVDKLKK